MNDSDAGHHLDWFKSSHSGSHGGDCVEVAYTPQLIHVRDSKTTATPPLAFTRDDWSALVAAARRED